MKYPPQIGAMPSRALTRLLRAQRISHRTFQNETASYRLSAPIERLRNEFGWPIISQWREERTLDPTGRNARYCVYYLPSEEIMRAGEQGQKYAFKVLIWEKRRNSKR
ncbi:hypothetical protein ACJJID_16635 [Microbulbifer sp. CnH-101-G]|uniref:hypothetical protein n=1 Tax=Microbulbifer sp. CnH-101-G TaxID=3243393 RepID=UPI004039298D